MRKRIIAVLLAAVLVGQGNLSVVGAACQETESATMTVPQETVPEGMCTVDISDGVLMYGGVLGNNTAVPSLGAGTQTDEEGAKAAIEAAWKNYRTSCDLTSYKITIGDIKQLYMDLLNEHPECFYVARSFSYSYSGSTVYSLTINYEYEVSEIISMKSKYDAEVALAVSGADMTWSDMEKVLYINEYLARNCEYDSTYSNYSAYNVLVDKTAVCQGYALAFKALAGQLGVECQVVTSDSLNHAWNMVKVNSSYYMLDCTWNDPTPDLVGQVYHKYFLKSTPYFNSGTGRHLAEDYQVSGSWDAAWASDTHYDTYFWDGMETGFDKIGDYWYAYDGTDSINRYACDGTDFDYQKDILAAVTDKWFVWGSTTQYYSGRTCIGSKNGRIYYSRPASVYSLNVDTGETALVYGLSEVQQQTGYIYGLVVLADGSVVAELSTSPIENGTVITIEKSPCADGHTYDEGIITQQPTCTQTGVKTYTCSVCKKTKTEEVETAGHDYHTIVTPATTAKAGSIVIKCTVCEDVSSSTVIPAVGNITLSDTVFEYNGLEQRPVVTVTDTAGKVLTVGTDYTLEYSGDGVQGGTYTVEITLQGNYTGTKSLTYRILPEGISILPPEQIIVPNTIKIVREAADRLPEGWSFCDEFLEQSIPAGGSMTAEAEYIPDGETESILTGDVIIAREACVENTAVCYTGEGEAAPTCTADGVGHTECSLCGETVRTGIAVPAVGHVYDEGIITQQPTCTRTGVKTYTCSVCKKTKTEEIEVAEHDYRVIVTPASIAQAGSIATKCAVCGDVSSSTVIPAVGDITLSATVFEYNGSEQRPVVTVTDTADNVLTAGLDYTLNYSGDGIQAGIYTVGIVLQGNYTGTKSLRYTILPENLSVLPPELPEQIVVPNTVKTVREAAGSLPEGWSFCTESAEQSIPAGASITAEAEYIPDGETESVLTGNVVITRDACIEAVGIYYTGRGEAAPTCTTNGVGHTECSLCGETMRTGIVVPALKHTYETTVTPAGISRAGSIVVKCARCNVGSSTPIAAIKSIALSKTTYTYNGKVQRPSVTIKDSAGKSLKKGTDYTVTYSAGCKNVGSYTVTVAFKGNYTGTKKLTYTITPKGTTISKLTAGKKGFLVKWKKQTSQTTGYELQYSTNRNFTKKSTKTVRISKSGTISRAVTKLTAKKKYYVRIRTYKTVKISGKSTRLYSAWSKAKIVTTKR